jgi:hypothetical protein
MSEHGHRTFVGTLVFVDVLDPRADALECARDAAARTVGHLDAEECLRLDHPRGAVLIFPGDPEDALFVALGLRDVLEHESSTRSSFHARLAVHLGPAKVLNGTAQGEGPTVAAQLASVAAAGQIVASRSFYEVLSSLSAEHRALLRGLGKRRTADGRELDVYELGASPRRAVETTWPAGKTPAAGTPVAAPIPLVTPIEPQPAAVAAPPLPPPPAPAPAIVTGGWVAGALEELAALLARSIGPLATTLVRRAARATQDPRALIAELAESIENGDDRRRFEDFGRSWVRRSRAAGTVPPTPSPPHTPGPPLTPGPGRPLGTTPRGAGGGGGGLAMTGVSPEQRAALEAALIPHLGPIARVMVDRVAREAPDWGAACQTLSASIPDHISREDFLRTLSGPSPMKGRTAVKAATRQGTLARPAPAPPPKRSSSSRPVAVEPATPPRARALVEEDLHRAEQALSRSLGPVARALVKRAARSAATPQELYASLAAELPEGPERERFLATQFDV